MLGLSAVIVLVPDHLQIAVVLHHEIGVLLIENEKLKEKDGMADRPQR